MSNNNNGQWELLVILLKEIAQDKGITQEDIAGKTGLQQSSVSRFFSLKFKPNLETFLEVAKAVGVNFFFEDKDGTSDLNKSFERAMEFLGRRAKGFSKN